ncbi:hypothetical protein BJ085DRAFT_32937 [Dimargaris cristalligena]|uniref:Uncharacterized protein n=1 Tax=Dimargaris cristalligena TaxID=215637 RepID=A0A4P9ZZE2_9FUNG|nr:hypothetical protein BJ085DRAFT_32937 [Dimargaris cristalligena]|eukprot:RKP38788.1 hypothetical protein BJ085DRAFT_32937 [Dimargaris cristalligena]
MSQYSTIPTSSVTQIFSVPAVFHPKVKLPLGRPNRDLHDIDTYQHQLLSEPIHPCLELNSNKVARVSLAILLSRYYSQSEVAFGYTTGPLSDTYSADAPLVWALFNVVPEAEVASLVRFCNDISVGHSDGIAESPPPPEVILHCNLSAASNLSTNSTPAGSIHFTDIMSEGILSTLLITAGVGLLVELSIPNGSAMLSITYSRNVYPDPCCRRVCQPI